MQTQSSWNTLWVLNTTSNNQLLIISLIKNEQMLVLLFKYKQGTLYEKKDNLLLVTASIAVF